MALYALGDLHLSFQADKPMDSFGKVWKNHEKKIEKYVNRMVKPEDTLVLTGNHDMFWDVKKNELVNVEYKDLLFFLQNIYAVYQDYALVGTKGFTFEGPFYLNRRGQILGWDEARKEQADKLVKREMERLQESFRLAEKEGYQKFIMFLHYPPTNILEKTSPFTEIAEKYKVSAVVYSHCHGESRFGDSIRGKFHGIEYMLVSGDYLNFRPAMVLP